MGITSIHRERQQGRFLLADLLVVEGERGWARYCASMEMHVLPLVVPLVPHAALLALLGMRHALSANQTERHVRVHGTKLQFNYMLYVILRDM